MGWGYFRGFISLGVFSGAFWFTSILRLITQLYLFVTCRFRDSIELHTIRASFIAIFYLPSYFIIWFSLHWDGWLRQSLIDHHTYPLIRLGIRNSTYVVVRSKSCNCSSQLYIKPEAQPSAHTRNMIELLAVLDFAR